MHIYLTDQQWRDKVGVEEDRKKKNAIIEYELDKTVL